MDERAIFLIRDSLAQLIPIAGQADAMFNIRLLDTYPELYRIFAMDIDERDRSFVGLLVIAVERLRLHGAIMPAASVLLRERKVYRVVHDNYVAVGLTLIWTLRRCLGAGFTVEVERAWQKALVLQPDCVAVNG